MLIFIEKQFVFFENHKTASSSFHQSLAPLADMVFQNHPHARHFSPRRFELKLLPMLMDHYWTEPPETAALIREPLDWLGSWYRYRQRPEIAHTPQSTADISFETFLETYLRQDKTPFAHVGQQSKFLRAANKTYPTHLWRFDNLEGFKGFLNDRLGSVIDLPHLNASETAEMSVSAKLRRKLEAFFEEDYKLYEAAKGV